jgi:hypothetical protein
MKKDYSKLIVPETDYDKYINKRLAWEKMKEMFPGKWVAISDYEFNEYSRLTYGVLRAICTDGEIVDVDKVLLKKYPHLYWRRISDILGVTLIW